MKSERNLILRIASAVVAIPLLFSLVLWRESLGFALLVFVAAAIGFSELGQLTLATQPTRARTTLILLGTAFTVALYLRPQWSFALALSVVVLVALDVLSSPGEIEGATRRLGMSVFAIFYLGGLIATLPLVHRDLPDGRLWVIGIFVVTFANDTGAYAAGRTLGRRKLAPTISPGKTLEGAIGGLIAGIGVLLAYRALFFPGMTPVDAIVIGTAAGILGPAGDLMESMLKRAAGAKDSGHLIPGHGGVLDRIDALLFNSAYVFIHTQFFR
jgi:phosphatidate cytidylyltransferase